MKNNFPIKLLYELLLFYILYKDFHFQSHNYLDKWLQGQHLYTKDHKTCLLEEDNLVLRFLLYIHQKQHR
jgi:hypothetical protein